MSAEQLPPGAQQQLARLLAKGAPYPPRFAAFGGKPGGDIDVGVSAMFIAIFTLLAITHMGLFKMNLRRGHFFVLSAVTFGFCMARIVTFSMRIAAAKHPQNIDVAIAAGVFVSAGVILLYVINLIYAQRVLRGYHPRWGNTKLVSVLFKAFYFSVVAVLIMVIVATVLSFFTTPLNTGRLMKIRNIQRFGSVFFTVFSFMPVPIVLAARFTPRSQPPENFGKKGGLAAKVWIVVAASALLTLESAFRAATAFLPTAAVTAPKWYHQREAFYGFLAAPEVCVVVLYAASRVDQRFFINGKAERKRAEEEKSRELKSGSA